VSAATLGGLSSPLFSRPPRRGFRYDSSGRVLAASRRALQPEGYADGSIVKEARRDSFTAATSKPPPSPRGSSSC